LLHLDQDDGVNIIANSLHPGGIATNLYRHNSAINGNYYSIILFSLSVNYTSPLMWHSK